MAINLKGYRNIVVSGKKYKYKCISHETTNVWDVEKEELFKICADNSGEVNRMSLPSIVADKIKEELLCH